MQEAVKNNNGHSLPPNHRVPKEYTLNEEQIKDLIYNATSRDTRALRQLMMEKRDYDSECDYPRDLSVDKHYKFYFDFHAVGTRVCEVLPLETWQVQPAVFEDDDPNVKTEFEKAWDELGSNLRGQSWHKKEEGSPVWEYLKRADILSGIGSFGVILLGFDDNKPLNTPIAMLAEEDDDEESNSWDTSPEGQDNEEPSGTVSGEIKDGDFSKPTGNSIGSIDSQYNGSVYGEDKVPTLKEGTKRKLIFMRPFDETLVQVIRLETDISSPRHNQPVMYRLTLIDPDFAKEHAISMDIACPEVHWTRILHIADNLTNSECFGVPRQQPVYRHLRNLYKLYGGAPEMYWRGAMNGISWETHPQLGGDVEVDRSAFRDDIENMRNGLQRDVITTGFTAKTLAPTISDPTPFIDGQITAICIKLGCPQRIFMGSERGELASTQDDSSWNDRLKHRQEMYVTPRIIIPFIDRMISTGVLPKPSGKLVESNLSEDDGATQTDISETSTDTVTNFNPNQPRNADGEFSSGSSGGKGSGKHVPRKVGDKIRIVKARTTSHKGSGVYDIKIEEHVKSDLYKGRVLTGPTAGMMEMGRFHSDIESKPTTNAFGKGSSIASKGGLGGQTAGSPSFGGKPSSGASSGDNVGTGPVAPPAPKARQLPEKDAEPGYCIVWPDLDSMTEAQKATIFLQKTQALMAFIAGNGESAMTLVDFYTKYGSMTDEEAIGVISAVNKQIEDDERLTPDPEEARQDEMDMQGEQFDKELDAKKQLAEQGHGFGMEMQDKQLQGQEKLAQLKPKGKPPTTNQRLELALNKARLLTNYSKNQPRKANGEFGSGGSSGGSGTVMSKSDRAKAAHVMVDKDIQRYSEEVNEPQFAKAMKGLSFPNSEPIDIAIPNTNGILQHGVELKTLVKNANGKLTMDTYAQVRKVNWERTNKATMHTVVFDDTKVFNAKGDGKHDINQREILYRRGVAGSARIHTLHKVEGKTHTEKLKNLKTLMDADEKSLPSGAARTDNHLRKGKWSAFQDGEGKGFKNQTTKQIVRAKK